ncbi:uncharacterized protein [Clytia hemisphaerica]|uniref:Uncharacterized protein n=1 Tax=Clytia hemisphaerica TaxID=252671 RepID=A0A7M5WU76_9CNID
MRVLTWIILLALVAYIQSYTIPENDLLDLPKGKELLDQEYIFDDLWEKVKSAANRLVDSVKASTQKIIEQYKPQILAALENVKKVVIKGVKDLIIEIVNGIVKIITDGVSSTSDGKDHPEFDLVSFPIFEVIDGSSIPRINFVTDAWKKVTDAFEKAGDKISNQTRALIEKYKPKVTDALTRVKKVIIDEGKRIVIEIIGDIVKIVVEDLQEDEIVKELAALSEDSELMDAEFFFSELWEKVKTAANRLVDSVKATTQKIIEQYKPQILAALENVQKVVIKGVKDLIIEVVNGIVKIITDGVSSTSDGKDHPEFAIVSFSIFEEIDGSSIPRINFVTDAWKKVTDAFEKAGDKISNQTRALIEKYKPKVTDALTRVKKVIIDEGKRIVIEIIGDIVKIVVEDLQKKDEIVKELAALSEDSELMDAEFFFSELWEKVKTAANRLVDSVKATTQKIIELYKPQILAALENVQKVVIKGAKDLIIEVVNGIVKIITDGVSSTSDGKDHPEFAIVSFSIFEEIDGSSIPRINFVTDAWKKVTDAFEKAGDKISNQTRALIEKYKPKVTDALTRVKKVIIDEGKRIVIEIIGDIVKIVVEDLQEDEIVKELAALSEDSELMDAEFFFSLNYGKR